MKVNTETTKLDRLRLVLGIVLLIAGALLLLFIGVIGWFDNILLAIVGAGLVVLGAVIGKSHKLAQILADLFLVN